MSVIEMPEVVMDAQVELSDSDLWKQEMVPLILKQMNEWSKWKPTDDETQKQEAYVKLLGQVSAWTNTAYMTQFPGRKALAFGDPGKARVIIFTPAMSRRQADSYTAYVAGDDRPSTHEQLAQTLSMLGLPASKVMFSACVPFYPAERWGENTFNSGFSLRPPKHIERALFFFGRQLMRIVQPTFVIATNALAAEMLVKMGNVAALSPSAFANYVSGGNEAVSSGGGRGPGMNFDSMGVLATYPLYFTGTASCTAVRIFHPYYLEKSTSVEVMANKQTQDALLKELAVTASKTGASSLAIRVRKNDIRSMFKKASSSSANSAKRQKTEEPEEPESHNARVLSVEDTELFDRRMLLTMCPMVQPDYQYLEKENRHQVWIDMCSRSRKSRDRGINVMATAMGDYQRPLDRWTPERIMDLVDVVQRAWTDGNRVAVYCNDGVHENSMFAACVALWVFPHLSPNHAIQYVAEKRGTDYLSPKVMQQATGNNTMTAKEAAEQAMSQAGRYKKIVEQFWRLHCWGRMELFLGKMRGDGYDYTVWAVLDERTHLRIGRFNWFIGSELFAKLCESGLKKNATYDKAHCYVTRRRYDGFAYLHNGRYWGEIQLELEHGTDFDEAKFGGRKALDQFGTSTMDEFMDAETFASLFF